MATITLSRYVLVSCIAALSVLVHAFATRQQYFAAMYFLGTCKLSIAILANCLIMSALLFYKLVTRVFLGRLRESEVERINERLHHGVVEICLTLTVFRQDFDARLILLMGILTMVKVFHWLIQDRINYMQTEPAITYTQHARTASFLAILLVLDTYHIHTAASAAFSGDKGYVILFMFEYTILACMAAASFIKYGLTVADLATAEPLANKGLYLIYLDLIIDGVTFVLYVAFFGMIMHHYKTIPLHLIRDIYMAYLSLVRRASNFVRYRTVSSKIHQLRDVTEEDLERVGRSCIICREDMALSEGLKKLHCDHVFHLACLRSWLERQQTCPICRHPILPTGAAVENAAADAAAPAPAAAAAAAPAADGAADGAAPPAAAAAAPPAQAAEQQPRGEAGAAPPAQPPAAGAAGAPQASSAAGVAAGAPAPAVGGHAARGGPGAGGAPRRYTAHAAGAAGVGSGVYGAWGHPGARSRTSALPNDAPTEMRAAFSAASKAFARLAPYYMPIYQPFGAEAQAGGGGDQAAPATGGASTSTAQTTGDQATGEALRAVPAMSAGRHTDTQNPQYERARRAASAAVAASITATRELLRGQITLLQERLERLDMVEVAALGEGRVGDDSGGT
eukprot:jgi/Ulvmu1/423/UM001_0430.1